MAIRSEERRPPRPWPEAQRRAPGRRLSWCARKTAGLGKKVADRRCGARRGRWQDLLLGQIKPKRPQGERIGGPRRRLQPRGFAKEGDGNGRAVSPARRAQRRACAVPRRKLGDTASAGYPDGPASRRRLEEDRPPRMTGFHKRQMFRLCSGRRSAPCPSRSPHLSGVPFAPLYHHDGRFIRAAGLFAFARRNRLGGGFLVLQLELTEAINRAAGPGHPRWAWALGEGLDTLLVHVAGWKTGRQQRFRRCAGIPTRRWYSARPSRPKFVPAAALVGPALAVRA